MPKQILWNKNASNQRYTVTTGIDRDRAQTFLSKQDTCNIVCWMLKTV